VETRSRIGVAPDGALPVRSYVGREQTTQERPMPSTLEQPRTNGHPTYSPPPPPPRRTQRQDDNSGSRGFPKAATLDMAKAHRQEPVQTVLVPAGGGGVFDVKIDQPGLYPFVSHSFAAVDLGQVGLLNVGNVKGTMSH
jgi:hypothetical protein